MELPPKIKKNHITLEQALLNRRSFRQFNGRKLTYEEISDLVWAAQGKVGEFRTAPSAGATYPMEIYILTLDGMFHYLPSIHSLEEITKKDLRPELAIAAYNQECMRRASIQIVICAHPEKIISQYGDRSPRYIYLEAGHIAQNIHLQATDLNLDSVAIGAFNDDSASKIVGDNVIYIVAVGEKTKKIDLEHVRPEILLNSQKGQDSLIQHIFERIGITNKIAVEFSAVDGYWLSNTSYLRDKQGWKTILFDNIHYNTFIGLHCVTLTPNNICSVFKECNVPYSFDFLSVDVDGVDYWLLAALLNDFSPRVIMVETNARFERDENVIFKYNPECPYGASPLAFKELVNQYNYTPVFTHQDDMFIVKNYCLDLGDLNKSWEQIYTPRPYLYQNTLNGDMQMSDKAKYLSITHDPKGSGLVDN